MFSQPSDRREAGFSGTKLLLVVAVVGVLAAIAHPVLDARRTQADRASAALAETLREARRAAVSRGHDVAVTFRPGAGSYTVHYDVDGDGSVDAGEEETTHSLPDGVQLGLGGTTPHEVGPGPVTFDTDRSGGRSVVFFDSGSASEGGGVYLFAKAKEDDRVYSRLVAVERVTGWASRFAHVDGGWKRQR